MDLRLPILCLLLALVCGSVHSQSPKLSEAALTVTLSNPLVSFTFAKNTAAMISIVKDGRE